MQQTVKRAIDMTGALVGLLLLAPLLVAVAVAVALAGGPGPVLYRQTRVGYKGRPFSLVKFRTMIHSAAEPASNDASGPLFKLHQDPRVTRVGAVLRRHSLDELPQLWNVLRGEMSLVGPRPALPAEVAAYTPRERGRLTVPPGLTGLWQVSGRSDLPFEEYIALDLAYVRRRSLAFDLLVLARTVPAVLSARGAY